jgi:APA family basic amino acid/polyamine antiporter
MTAQIGATLALSMWLYSGYYEVSAAAEEIDAPARNIPLALLILSPLVVASYALPTMAGLMAVGGWQAWTSGEFTSMGRTIAGPTLGYWLFLGSAASQAVIFLSYLLWWSRLVQAMAADGHLPAFLSARHPRYGTPHRILIGYGLIYAAMAALPFEDLLVADVWLAGASNLILQASLVRSRRGPEPTRGFQIPGGRAGLWLNALLPVATWLLVIALTARDHLWLGGAALLAGPLLYLATRTLRARARA